MTLTDKLLKISQLVHGDGGINYIKIRLFLEDVDIAIINGHPRAQELDRALSTVLKVLEHVTAQPLEKQ